MFVDDYVPKKRIGVEELEGCVNIFDRLIDEDPDKEISPLAWMMSGARLALHLMLVSKFRYPEDFVNVFLLRCRDMCPLSKNRAGAGGDDD